MSEQSSTTSSSTFRREVNISSQKRSVDVPIQKLDFSVLDTEFGSAKDKFDLDMARMDAEMNKLRTDFFGGSTQMPSIMGAGDPFGMPEMPRLGGGMPPPIMPPMDMPPMPVMDTTGGGVQKTVTSQRTVTKTVTSSDGTEQRETSKESSHREVHGDEPGPVGARQLESPDEVWKNFMQRNPSSPLIQDEADGKQLRLRFDVHSYKPEDIEVKTVDNTLQVSARHEEKSDKRQESREFRREILLPPQVDPDHLRSSLSKDGILTVKAPLLPPAIEGGQGPIVTSPPPTQT